jgi:23S rRNA pseudouridine955/2504/2580 synthase
MCGMSTQPSTETVTGVRIVTIDARHDGQRLDNFLMRELKGVPRGHIYRLLRTGQVRVNRGRCDASRKLCVGDEVRLPPVRMSEPKEGPDIPPGLLALLRDCVLHEDADLLIINKPAGLAVHAGSGVDYGVIEAMREARPDLPELELLHRLDRDTSGCLMLSKNRAALTGLQTLIRRGGLYKQYQALVRGVWRGGQREVDAPLRKNTLSGGERMVRVDPREGKPSRSIFAPEKVFAQASLMRVEIPTGRTHQIRVHAAHIGYPLAGDEKYGDADFNRRLREKGLRRLFLHARTLRFTHPVTGRTLEVSAPLPVELVNVIEALTRP